MEREESEGLPNGRDDGRFFTATGVDVRDILKRWMNPLSN